VTRAPGAPLALGAAITVIDLASVNAQGNSQLTLTFPARIMAVATVVLLQNSASPVDVTCSLSISDGSGPSNGLTSMGEFSKVSVPPAISSTPFETLTVSGAAAKGAGTYNVVASCSASAVGTSFFQRGNLLVWAIAN